MSIIRRTSMLTSSNTDKEKLTLKNPRKHRSLIFRAIRDAFWDETKDRVTNYTAHGRSSKAIEDTTRRYSGVTEPFTIDFTIKNMVRNIS